MKQKKRVIVAMSGGVDSSVAAALLKECGFDVIGVTMRLWSNSELKPNTTTERCFLEAVESARKDASCLDIPHYVMDFNEDFYNHVIEYFIKEYSLGRTPNPCIACNRFIKFETFLNRALALEADHIATGHYARVHYDRARNRFLLKTAIDTSKDQTYMLYSMSQYQLKYVLFPLGNYYKQDVRKIAARFGLPIAERKESQEICFIPDNDYRQFLRQFNSKLLKPGPIVDASGKCLGTHSGISFYTIGQRRELGLAVGKPLYVVKIIPEENTIVVGTREETLSSGLEADNINLISVGEINKKIVVEVKIRYQSKRIAAELYPPEKENNRKIIKVCFFNSQHAVTPGQAVVFYQDEEVIGGGTILRCLN